MEVAAKQKVIDIEDLKTYGIMLVGFWSAEFLSGWGGVILTFTSIAWVLYQLISRIREDFLKNKIKKL